MTLGRRTKLVLNSAFSPFLLAVLSNNSKFIIFTPTTSTSVIAGKNVFLSWDNVVNGLVKRTWV